jgi:hypothetical protein
LDVHFLRHRRHAGLPGDPANGRFFRAGISTAPSDAMPLLAATLAAQRPGPLAPPYYREERRFLYAFVKKSCH